jgi:hypothetical protein
MIKTLGININNDTDSKDRYYISFYDGIRVIDDDDSKSDEPELDIEVDFKTDEKCSTIFEDGSLLHQIKGLIDEYPTITELQDLLDSVTTKGNLSDFTIVLSGEVEDVKEFIDNNPELLNYTLRYCSEDDNSLSQASYYAQVLRDYPNIYLVTNNNSKFVTVEAYLKTCDYIDSIVGLIKSRNLSPIEQIMYAYDVVRNRIYNAESDNEDQSVSRDVTDVTLGDKIVCLGYARLLNEILTRLGFNCAEYLMDDTQRKEGHAISAICIKDDKYAIDGVYFFDPTWDSKKENETTEYLSHYNQFAMHHSKMIRSHQGYDLYNINIITKQDLYRIVEIMEKGDYSKLTDAEFRSINFIAYLVDRKSLLTMLHRTTESYRKTMPPKLLEGLNFNTDEILEKFLRYIEIINTPIRKSDLRRILYEVRKHEYYDDPEYIPYSYEELEDTIDNSGWSDKSKEELFLSAVFGEDEDSEEKEREINMVKLSRTIKDFTDKQKKSRK